MELNINKKEIINALKNVEMKGKWAGTSGLSTKALGNYVNFKLHNNRLLIINADESTTAIKSITVETEDEGFFTLEISTIRKYLDKMGDEIKLTVDDTVVIQSNGKRATLPIVIRHPHQERINNFIEHYPFERENNIPKIGSVNLSCGVEMSAVAFQEAITACEIVNNGIYRLDYVETDDISDAKFLISSNMQVASYREDLGIINSHGESATVIFSGPIHKFFNKDETITIYLGDNEPILILSEGGAILRAPRAGI